MRKSKSKKIGISLAKVRAVPRIPIPANENGPTLERLVQAGLAVATRVRTGKVEIVGTESPFGADGVCRLQPAPLDRLHARRQLDPTHVERNRQLFDAGDRFRTHWYRAGLSGLGSVDLNRTGGGNGDPAWLMPSSESAAYHRQRHRSARLVLDPTSWAAVFAVCCGEEDLVAVGRTAGFGNENGATAVALDRLRRGLELLAVLYGILPPPRPANANGVEAASAAA